MSQNPFKRVDVLTRAQASQIAEHPNFRAMKRNIDRISVETDRFRDKLTQSSDAEENLRDFLLEIFCDDLAEKSEATYRDSIESIGAVLKPVMQKIELYAQGKLHLVNVKTYDCEYDMPIDVLNIAVREIVDNVGEDLTYRLDCDDLDITLLNEDVEDLNKWTIYDVLLRYEPFEGRDFDLSPEMAFLKDMFLKMVEKPPEPPFEFSMV